MTVSEKNINLHEWFFFFFSFFLIYILSIKTFAIFKRIYMEMKMKRKVHLSALMLNYLPLSLWKKKSFYQSVLSYLQSYKTHCNNHHHLHLILQYSENSVSSLYSIWVNLNFPDNNFIYRTCFLFLVNIIFTLKVPYTKRT